MPLSATTTRLQPRKFSPIWLPCLLFATLLYSVDFAVGAAAAKPADSAAASAATAQATYEKEIRPLVQQYCGGCHGPTKPRGGINLSTFETVASLQRDQTTWRDVLTQIHERNMPPANKPQPTAAQRDRLTSWLKETLDNVDESLVPRNPGRVLIHRLSRMEYNNTVRDLFGVDSRPADRFPADGGGGGGFDNNADTLFIPPILMERYLEAASDILAEAKPERIFFVQPGERYTPREAARRIIEHFANRAFRRPVEMDEMKRLMRLFDAVTERGEFFPDAVRLSLKAILVSPNFLFRVERDQESTEAYLVGDYELASRLSYFLWSSMPDDELFQLAAQKQLREPRVLEQQVRRMMQSPKFSALANSFAGQWLRVRDLYSTVQPDPKRYPTFTPSLRDAMYKETIEFFQGILRDDASLLRLLDADYTYLNEELAKHYGIEGVQGAQMRRVTLKEGRRGGVLTMGSVLTLTSYPQRTSPVLRGKWVLEEIVGSPPPPPPPGAGALPANDAPKDGMTFRQRLELHRAKPECASCHSRMDPLGFGLENFDATGRWREEIGGQPVDSSGVLANGEKFSGPVELKKHLMTRKEEFVRNLTERMLSYSLGRGLETYDIPTVKAIATKVQENDYRSSTLILEIVKSYPFQYRKNL